MKADWSHLDYARANEGDYKSPNGATFGAFYFMRYGIAFFVIACDAEHPESKGWEHVSVHAKEKGRGKRTPTWEEMCYIKSLFWNPDELVLQYHPPQEDYVNMHENVLHLWKSVDKEIPMPPQILV